MEFMIFANFDCSNVAPDIASLNIGTAASLTQQKKEDARKSRDGKTTKAPEPPLKAPQPTRVSSAGWNPDAGIRFGTNGSTVEQQEQPSTSKPKATNWDPNKPIRFG
jgi:hypothetical protein